MDTMILHTMNSFHSYGLGCHSQLGYAYLIRYIEKTRSQNSADPVSWGAYYQGPIQIGITLVINYHYLKGKLLKSQQSAIYRAVPKKADIQKPRRFQLAGADLRLASVSKGIL